MEVVQFILDAICGNYLIVLPVLFILGSISAYNVAKRQANAYRRPLLRSNNDCLEYYDYRIEVWLPVYGREDMGSYE